MRSSRLLLSPLLAFAVLLAPVMCCCTGAMAFASVETAETAPSSSPCGKCPEESNSNSDRNSDEQPGHSDDCDCEQTLIAQTTSLEIKVNAPVELPSLALTQWASTRLAFSQEMLSSVWYSGEPPGPAARTRLSLLCVLRI